MPVGVRLSTSVLLLTAAAIAAPVFGATAQGPCPPSAMFSQGPELAGEPQPSNEMGDTLLEDFSGLGLPVKSVTWWGLYAGQNPAKAVACDPPSDTFEIVFWEDTGAFVGRELARYRLVADRTDTGIISFEGTPAAVHKFDVTLPVPVAMGRGWIEIVAVDNGTCTFYWLPSSDGDANGLSRFQNGDLTASTADFSLCLVPEAPPPARDCLGDALYGQPVFPRNAQSFSIYTSNVQNAGTDVAAEKFSALAEPFRTITWWGVENFNNGIVSNPCVRSSNAFRVNVYEDNAGEPGALTQSMQIFAARYDTGEIMVSNGNYPIYRYTATLPAAVNLSDGWLGIVGITDISCFFMWCSSSLGDGASYQDVGSGFMEKPADLSFCVAQGPPGGEGEGEGEGEGPVQGGDCFSGCPPSSPDADGDGLTACQETCFGSSDFTPDSDADGLPDNFEFSHGTNPLSNDARNDIDQDGLSNLDEFLRGSDPEDPNDPAPVYYVDPNGIDAQGRGTAAAPWQRVFFALTQLDPTPENPITIVMAAGEYIENFDLEPGTRLVGQGENTVIIGRITGADDCELLNLELRPPRSTDTILEMNDVQMHLAHVTLRGDSTRRALGVLTEGANPFNSVLEDCTFTSLQNGIDIGESIPLIRHVFFNDLSGSAVIIRAPQTASPDNPLGDSSNPQTGWNSIDLPSIDGPGVINERSSVILMQEIDWSTDHTGQIDAAISGPSEFVPFKAAGSAILASSLFFTVWDKTTQVPIENAVLELQVSDFAEVTENTNGVYSYPVISEGSYTLTATAPGHTRTAVDVQLNPGETKSMIVAMPAGNDVQNPAPCCQQKEFKRPQDLLADATVLGLSLLLMLTWRKFAP